MHMCAMKVIETRFRSVVVNLLFSLLSTAYMMLEAWDALNGW